MLPSASPVDQVVRISLFWIIVGFIAIILLGFAGGLLAQQFFRSPLPLSNDSKGIVTTVQEVTISPNTAVAELVERTNRSVVLISRGDSGSSVIVGSGVVVTNDGVVMSTVDLETTVQAHDHDGRILPLQRIGRDELFGITYYRLAENVVVPLDLRQEDSPVGQELVLITRNATTFQPKIHHVAIAEYALPANSVVPAWQKVLVGTPLKDTTSQGGPLLDDEGKIAALLSNPEQGIAMPVSHLQASLARVTNNQREVNPFAALGFTVNFGFKTLRPTDGVRFVAEVVSTAPTSSAAVAGLQRGDLITAVGDSPVAWQQSIIPALSADFPVVLQIQRRDTEQTITLQAQPSPL